MIGALLRLRSSDSVLPAKDVSQGVLFDQGEGTFGSNLEFDMIWLCEGTSALVRVCLIVIVLEILNYPHKIIQALSYKSNLL